MSENMEEMKRCLASKAIRVTLPNACGPKINRFSQESLEGSGCERKRYNNVGADSHAGSSADSDGAGVGGGDGSSPLIFVHQ